MDDRVVPFRKRNAVPNWLDTEGDALTEREKPLVPLTGVLGSALTNQLGEGGVVERVDQDICPTCGKPPEWKPLGLHGGMVPIQCACKMADYEAGRALQARLNRLEAWRNKHEPHLPPRMHGRQTILPPGEPGAYTPIGLDDLPQTRKGIAWSRRYLATIENNIATGSGMFFWGGRGTGKGTVSRALAGDIERAGYSVVWAKLSSIVDRSMDKEHGLDVLRALESADVVILDELGYDGENRATTRVLYHVVDHRYEAGKPTIMTSNFSRKEMGSRYESINARSPENDDRFNAVSTDRFLSRFQPPRFWSLEFEGSDIRDEIADQSINPYEGL